MPSGMPSGIPSGMRGGMRSSTGRIGSRRQLGEACPGGVLKVPSGLCGLVGTVYTQSNSVFMKNS